MAILQKLFTAIHVYTIIMILEGFITLGKFIQELDYALCHKYALYIVRKLDRYNNVHLTLSA